MFNLIDEHIFKHFLPSYPSFRWIQWENANTYFILNKKWTFKYSSLIIIEHHTHLFSPFISKKENIYKCITNWMILLATTTTAYICIPSFSINYYYYFSYIDLCFVVYYLNHGSISKFKHIFSW